MLLIDEEQTSLFRRSLIRLNDGQTSRASRCLFGQFLDLFVDLEPVSLLIQLLDF